MLLDFLVQDTQPMCRAQLNRVSEDLLKRNKKKENRQKKKTKKEIGNFGKLSDPSFENTSLNALSNT